MAVCGLNSAGQYAKGDGLLAKLELEVPDEVKLAQAEVELTPAFMTKSGDPYKCPPWPGARCSALAKRSGMGVSGAKFQGQPN